MITPELNTIPASFWSSIHPSGQSAWPLVFITIACGAVSGFHSTQSPLMARCLANEKYGRTIFYGAMCGEGLIAMVWVLLGIAFFNNGYATTFDWSNSTSIANSISAILLGKTGCVLAILGVIILPITSGDTAFRSARLIVADAFNIDQKSCIKCLMIAAPIFATGFICNIIGFDTLWQYFGWSNQTLAAIGLWLGAVYLRKRGNSGIIALVPAAWMTLVISTFFCNSKLMFIKLPISISTIIGAVATLFLLMLALRVQPEGEAVTNKKD